MAIYLINSNKKSVQSTYIAKEIGVTHKTAWFMLHRIKEACQDESFDLQEEIYKHTKEGSYLVTDSYSAYDVLCWNYNHSSVKHSAGEYVKTSSRVAFKIHTNSIEGFWSMVKRGIYGVYHWASAKHINKYLNEYSRKYNTKELTKSERFYNFFENIQRKITYKQLISA